MNMKIEDRSEAFMLSDVCVAYLDFVNSDLELLVGDLKAY